MKIIVSFFLLFFFSSVSLSFPEEKSVKPNYWEKLKSALDDAKSDDNELRKKALKWIDEDIKKIGDWEYKVIEIEYNAIGKLEKILNESGNDRWECFWIDKDNKGFTLILKRPKFSYIQKLPKGELLKLFKD